MFNDVAKMSLQVPPSTPLRETSNMAAGGQNQHKVCVWVCVWNNEEMVTFLE